MMMVMMMMMTTTTTSIVPPMQILALKLSAGGYMNDVWVWFADTNNMDRILYETQNPAQVISRRQDARTIVWGATRVMNARGSPSASSQHGR